MSISATSSARQPLLDPEDLSQESLENLASLPPSPTSHTESYSNKSWSLLSCCSLIGSKIYQVFYRCRASRRYRKLDSTSSEVPPFPSRMVEDSTSSCSEKCKKVFSVSSRVLGHKYTIGFATITSIAGMVASAVSVSPIYKQYSYACAAELSGFSGDLRACQQPYHPRIALYESLIAASCGLLGFILQKSWERDLNPFSQAQEKASPPPSGKQLIIDKIKTAVGHIQDRYSYEISIGLGYLYDGVWTDTSTPASWVTYFNCHAAAIGLASSCLGMYIRILWTFILEHLQQRGIDSSTDPTVIRLKDNHVLLTTSGIAIVTLGVSSFSLFPQEANKVVRELSMMLMVRPLGKVGADWISKLRDTPKEGWKKYASQSLLTAVKVLPSPLVISAYLAYYLSSPSDAPQLTGMALIGIAQGMRESRFVPIQLKEQNSTEKPPTLEEKPQYFTLARKTGDFIKSYWKTIGIVGFWITSAKLSLLDCYDYTTSICPISFELSSNYVQLDQRGMNVALATGLTHYYTRKLFRLAEKKDLSGIKHIAKWYLHLFDKYQFDIISLIPFTMTKSGKYTPEYNVYACLNPPFVMTFVGISFGTYKDNVDVQAEDPSRPAFTDMAIVKNAFPIL